MEMTAVLLSSAVVSAIVGSIAAYISQRRLATDQARVEYEFAARKRLYEAIGPQRFQLLMAARDFDRRVRPHHTTKWEMSNAYYLSSFVYRLLRPIAIADLIQRQVALVDFSVDPTARQLLRFEAATYRLLVSDDPLPYYEHLDGGSETQHVYRDNLRVAATTLITTDPSGRERVIDYATFCDADIIHDERLESVTQLFESCEHNLAVNAVWWVRVVGVAYACAWLVAEQGAELGFSTNEMDVHAMIGVVDDAEIIAHLDEYPALFDKVLARPL
jgi:hypothetical protein